MVDSFFERCLRIGAIRFENKTKGGKKVLKILTEIALGIGTMYLEDELLKGNSSEVTDEELVQIYVPIRKALMKRYRVAPAIIPGITSENGEKVITFMGGASMRREVIAFAMNDFERYLRKYLGSGKNLEMFVGIMEVELGVEDNKFRSIIPTGAWLKSQQAN